MKQTFFIEKLMIPGLGSNNKDKHKHTDSFVDWTRRNDFFSFPSPPSSSPPPSTIFFTIEEWNRIFHYYYLNNNNSNLAIILRLIIPMAFPFFIGFGCLMMLDK